MESIAHIRNSDGTIQTVEEHLLAVKKLAETSGKEIGIKHLCGLAGILHDAGKFSSEFKEYILAVVNNPDAPPKRGSVDHSTAGAKILYKLYHEQPKSELHVLTTEIVGNAVLSHHSYLRDYLSPEFKSDYLERVKDKEIKKIEMIIQNFYIKVMPKAEFIKYVDNATEELKVYLKDVDKNNLEREYMLLTKFIFSSLLDADRTNTRQFEENQIEDFVLNHEELFAHYYARLTNHLDALKSNNKAKSKINQLRSEMSEECDKFAEYPSGIYTLSIPTGGGKTLASLRYGLKHALKYGKKRIIYVVPFTTIIEQNANEIRHILDDDLNIFKHHSNVVIDKDDNENLEGYMDKSYKLKLAKDNWNTPIILTTMVQFLDVFFAKGNRNTRRLHNLSESVIIFDEVQKVPIKCVSLFNMAVNFLKTRCHSSILLCTATQPALDYVENKLDINTDAEIINNLDNVVDAFKRVEIMDEASGREMTTDTLSEFVQEKMVDAKSVLIILNTKKVVKHLYNNLKKLMSNTYIYHLSTAMCAAHRNEILKEIRDKLKKGQRVICVSTQLIEAGVDVSFHCVIRSLAGLDSIAQAAGRCNRHGESEMQQVYIVDHREENLSKLKEINEGKKITKRLLIDMGNNAASHGGNLLSKKAMDRYFLEFYSAFEYYLNYPIKQISLNMVELLTCTRENEKSLFHGYLSKTGETPKLLITNSYKTAADHFNVIDNNTTSMLVPYGEGAELITALNSYEGMSEMDNFFRQIQQYTVNVYEHEMHELIKNNCIVHYLDSKVIALTKTAYNEEYGLDIDGDGGFGILEI